MNLKFPAPDLPPATRRMIHGIASSERVVDGSRSSDGSDNSVMLAGGCALAVPIPLLCEHSGGAIGKVIHLCWIGSQLYCRAVVFDNAVGRQTWQKIARYELRGLSCGFTRDHYQIRLKEEGVVKYFDRYKITEMSVVHSPLNKDCFFQIYSGGLEGRVAGMPSLSEIRQINARARVLLARLDEKYPSKAENENSGKQGLSAVERRRFDAWYKKSFTDAKKGKLR